MKNTIFIAGVSERDIDLLLLEEFMSTAEFCSWFVAEAKLDQLYDAMPTKAMRSVTSSNGESDLEIEMKLRTGANHLLLIENKVSAGFQPNQAKRYQERGENYVKQGFAFSFSTVLIAPTVYFQGACKGFNARVNYETLVEWFSSHAAIGDRRTYKLSLLKSAIERSSLGYQMLPNDAVSQFWYQYWLLVSEIAPELRMEKPGIKPADSTFVYFRGTKMTQGMKIGHKLTHGNFDIEISGQADQLPALEAKYGRLMYEGLQLVRAGKSAAIRATVPVLSVVDDFEAQKVAVTEGIREGVRLYQWMNDIAVSSTPLLVESEEVPPA